MGINNGFRYDGMPSQEEPTGEPASEENASAEFLDKIEKAKDAGPRLTDRLNALGNSAFDGNENPETKDVI